MGDGTTTHTQNLLDKKTRPRIALAYPILALQQTRLPRMKGFHAMRLIQEGSFAYFTADIAFDPAKPSLIFIHGAAMDGGFWKLQLEALGHAVNPLALNLPGRKKNEALAAFDTTAKQAAHVLDFLDHMHLQHPAVCGLSMGGAVVLTLLAKQPSRFSRGIIINSGARLRVNPMIFDLLQKDFKAFRDMQLAFSISPHTTPEKIKPFLDAASTDNPETALRDFKACDTFDIMDQLQSIKAPVLVLTASEDALSPMKYGAYLKEKIHQARMECIEKAGHLSPLEAPEAVNRAILDFMCEDFPAEDLCNP